MSAVKKMNEKCILQVTCDVSIGLFDRLQSTDEGFVSYAAAE